MWAQIIDGVVQLVGDASVGLPLPEEFLKNNKNVLCIDISRESRKPEAGYLYLNDAFYSPKEFLINDRNTLVSSKSEELKKSCEEAIHTGVSVETSVGTFQFSLEEHDQTELLGQKAELEKAMTGHPSTINLSVGVPYHANGELCRFWSIPDFVAILTAGLQHVFYHRTYINHLLTWIRDPKTTPEEVYAIKYGDELPEKLARNMHSILRGGGNV